MPEVAGTGVAPEFGARRPAVGREARRAGVPGVPACPQAGGVGLCEYVQHLSAFDYIAVSASLRAAPRSTSTTTRAPHEHPLRPVAIHGGRYMLMPHELERHMERKAGARQR